MDAGKNINPTGNNGKIMLCKSCGSYRHLMKNYPDKNAIITIKTYLPNEVKLVVLIMGRMEPYSRVPIDF